MDSGHFGGAKTGTIGSCCFRSTTDVLDTTAMVSRIGKQGITPTVLSMFESDKIVKMLKWPTAWRIEDTLSTLALPRTISRLALPCSS